MRRDKARSGLVLASAIGLTLAGRAWGADVCFRTAGQAAAQRGTADSEGFRLEGVSQDAMGGKNWATVRSCGHPERPSMLVRVADGQTTLQAHGRRDEAATNMGHPSIARVLVVAGARVRVVSAEAMVRLEAMGVAQGPGGLGDVVKVRLLGEGEPMYVSGVVKSAEWLEMVR
ncbi:MAG: hypothetical protein M3Y74_18720 [Chloroflexota bacterium]|nr:hypothetical protein [Chloroflexota bacterium]